MKKQVDLGATGLPLCKSMHMEALVVFGDRVPSEDKRKNGENIAGFSLVDKTIKAILP